MTVYLLTHKEDDGRWQTHGPTRQDCMDRTAAGRSVSGRWSTGQRKHELGPGDIGYVVEMGVDPPGVIATCVFTSSPQEVAGWRPASSSERFADLRFTTVLPTDERLPLRDVQKVIERHLNHLQGSGTRLSDEDAAALKLLWDQHLVDVGRAAWTGPGWQADPVRRKAVEDFAQKRLEQHYRKRLWIVKDHHIGHPYDAVATKGGQRLYLEAKGTTGDGSQVWVTPGEVDFARGHAGECVIGIVSFILMRDDGTINSDSGNLQLYNWNPDEGRLTTRAYAWAPGRELL